MFTNTTHSHVHSDECLESGKNLLYTALISVHTDSQDTPSGLALPTPSTCYLSSCCRAVFMDFTCWKWQDMSVANTISITKARSSLSRQTEKRPVLSALGRTKGCGEKKAGIRVSGMLHAVLCSHKLVLGEIDKNVHLIVLHHSKNRADVVILQHRAIVVQDGTFRPVKLYVTPSPL